MAKADKQIHICDDWLTAEFSDLEIIYGLCDQIRNDEHWVEVVGGLQSVAVQFDPQLLTPHEALALFEKQLASYAPATARRNLEIQFPVCYHPDFGPDQELVADRLGIQPDDIASWHSRLEFTVTMLGFMPGFGYLHAEDTIPDIGRLPQPRQNVAAGSIGLIGHQSCVYSFDSPGGWPIIGRTPANLFDANGEAPALLSAGQTVRFVAIDKNEFEELL
ncbi:MAG: carboxyltransferase domain-containing protein [Parasphingorhabdus sp.]